MTSTAERDRRAGWFIGPTMLLATTCAMLLVVRGADRAFGAALALLIAVSIAWILVCVFWPGAPDRTCSECGRDGLKRLDPASTRGVLCSACGASDAERSSFLFAEEENGPLEPLVVRERERERMLRR
ncbi:MAG: hypothetical protein ACKVXR_16745 [Planctomycetota bacterium]